MVSSPVPVFKGPQTTRETDKCERRQVRRCGDCGISNSVLDGGLQDSLVQTTYFTDGKVGSERRSPLPRVPQLPPTPGAALAAAQEATGSLLLSSPMFPQVFPFPSEL